MTGRKLLLLSSSRVHGYEFLEHSKEILSNFLQKNGVKEVNFLPYADASGNFDGYTKKIEDAIGPWGFIVKGHHTFADPVDGIRKAQCIFIGGGNTFLLLKTLIEKNIVPVIRDRVLDHSIPYIGSSAGTNVATVSINTTNDMPIIYPPTFDAIGLVPFNINPHYLDADPNNKHQGETRETRIREFHSLNTTTVVGLREGTCLLVDGNKIDLLGAFNARIFRREQEPLEVPPNSDLSWLLN